MRKRITIDGKNYRPVPWLKDMGCDGCAFNTNGCINGGETDGICGEEGEFFKMILIPATNRGWADYIALRLEEA